MLIWNTAPASNVAPDVVVGQDTFTTNNPGTARNRMNWPMSLWMAGGKLFVTDTQNERLMIWNTVPTTNGASADVIINRSGSGLNNNIRWPWGIWSDGTKMVMGGMQAAKVLIWNTVPTSDDVAANIAVEGRDSGGARFGTPRHVFSNGTTLLVGDHNATVPGKAQAGTFVWNTFPTTAASVFSFFREDYVEPNNGPWMKGAFLNGALWTFGKTVYKWNTPPTSESNNPDLQLSAFDYMLPGDYGGVAFAGGKMYLATGNGNKIAGFNAPPTSASAVPDFAVGSPTFCANTLDNNYIIQNGVPRANSQSLFVSSDFDRKLYVWSTIPDQSNPTPSYIFRLPFQPWSIALHSTRLAIAGERSVYIWETLPTSGAMPSRQLRDTIGNVTFDNIMGVAMDAANFYVADGPTNRLYVWTGLPTASSNPAFFMNITGVLRISSDGTYLAVVKVSSHQVLIYEVATLAANSVPIRTIGGVGTFNLPQDVYVGNGRLFVADTSFHRVVGWTSLASAIAGGASDLVIGESSLVDQVAEIGRNKTFMPGSVFYDGRFLWVGELKFSDRMMRYSPPCSYHMLSAVSQTVPAPAGTGSVTITPNDSTCAWTAASNSSFLTVTSGSGSTGTGTVTFNVDSNTTGAQRTGTLTIGARTYSVTQNPFVNGDPFTDNTLTVDTSAIKAIHITELRVRINALRSRANLSAFSFTDSSLSVGSTGVKAIHITELRTALAQAYAALGETAPTYTDPSLAATTAVKRLHITELRAAVVTLEIS